MTDFFHSSLGGFALFALGLLAACEKEEPERYPYAGDCKGASCGVITIGGGGGGGGTSGATGDAGLPTEERETLVVRVNQADATVVIADPISRVQVSLPGVSTQGAETLGATLVKLPWAELPTWLRTDVKAGTNSDTLFHSTLRWVSTEETPIQLMVAERAPFEDIANALVVEPTSLRPDSGHVVFRVVQPSGVPVAGASFSVTAGVIAYDVGATFNDSVTETGELGLALWLNAPLSTGVGTRLNLTYAGKTSALQVPVLADCLTLLSVGTQ